ncbi:hypothetical protein SAMD00023353_5500220 [Rosellinia necatrix]|uniref:Uncharacterized protein n=1 Tax=Rosellinia necatrix TaxID=77044 RepID=A0A1W2TQW5_ROSNE|nr:hypothetical protein SAMD00023353_5500220 [Rosellinia necatrix]
MENNTTQYLPLLPLPLEADGTRIANAMQGTAQGNNNYNNNNNTQADADVDHLRGLFASQLSLASSKQRRRQQQQQRRRERATRQMRNVFCPTAAASRRGSGSGSGSGGAVGAVGAGRLTPGRVRVLWRSHVQALALDDAYEVYLHWTRTGLLDYAVLGRRDRPVRDIADVMRFARAYGLDDRVRRAAAHLSRRRRNSAPA